jgi:hypothetical protein
MSCLPMLLENVFTAPIHHCGLEFYPTKQLWTRHSQSQVAPLHCFLRLVLCYI